MFRLINHNSLKQQVRYPDGQVPVQTLLSLSSFNGLSALPARDLNQSVHAQDSPACFGNTKGDILDSHNRPGPEKELFAIRDSYE